jgi:type II secretory pathway pseudopilin PulG
MKSTTRQSSTEGMTLLELTVVILVLLSLISILFIGSRAWKRGSDRAGCVLNIHNAQNAVRAYQNVRALPDGASLNMFTDLTGYGKFLEVNPECPGGGEYEHISHIPYPGELALVCSLASSEEHLPKNLSDW